MKAFLNKSFNPNFALFFSAVWISLALISCGKKDPAPEPEPVFNKAAVLIKPPEKVTQTTATLMARVVPNEAGTSVAFEYRTSGTNWATFNLPTTFSGKDSITVTYDLSDLKSGTWYSFRVKAVNKGGETISSESNFTTGSYLRPLVTIKAAEKVTLNSATVVAKLVPNEESTKVSFEYKTADSNWLLKELPLTFKGKDSIKVTFDLSDLKPGTVYSFRVRAINAGGESVSTDSQFETYSVMDFDGNGYHIVTIGAQTWLRENFKGTHYANGDPIANVTDLNSWINLSTGAYCWYNNDPKIGEVYGGLYNWYVGADPRGLIIGWKVPTIYEFITLKNFLGGYSQAGQAVMETGTTHWQNPSRLGTNSSGFTALPNGALGVVNKVFMNLGEDATIWSSTSEGSSASSLQISKTNTWFNINLLYEKNLGFGLRLLQN
jgi:uncharacterized protein (TIGR02145 family)